MARPFQTTLQGFTGASRPHEAVAGRLLGVHGGVLHSLQIHHGRELSYWSHRVRPVGSTDGADRDLAQPAIERGPEPEMRSQRRQSAPDPRRVHPQPAEARATSIGVTPILTSWDSIKVNPK